MFNEKLDLCLFLIEIFYQAHQNAITSEKTVNTINSSQWNLVFCKKILFHNFVFIILFALLLLHLKEPKSYLKAVNCFVHYQNKVDFWQLNTNKRNIPFVNILTLLQFVVVFFFSCSLSCSALVRLQKYAFWKTAMVEVKFGSRGTVELFWIQQF